MIYIILAIVIVAAAIIIAVRNFSHYHSILYLPSESYGVYIIQNPHLITSQFIDKLAQAPVLTPNRFSFEVLFKGKSKALLVYTSNQLLKYFKELKLIEIEDYTQMLSKSDLSYYEIDLLDHSKFLTDRSTSFKERLDLAPNEQLYWQLVLRSGGQRGDNFFAQLRLVIDCQDKTRHQRLKEIFDEHISKMNLKIVEIHHDVATQVANFGQRMLGQKNLTLTPSELVSVLNV